MADADFTIESGAIYLRTAWDKTILGPVYDNAGVLGEYINERIQGRTPVDKGGLVASETYEVNTDRSDPTLVTFSSEDGPQLDAWGRVYVTFQEGPPLGRSTYTNDPRQMYYRAESEDIGEVQAYLDMMISDGVRAAAEGRSL